MNALVCPTARIERLMVATDVTKGKPYEAILETSRITIGIAQPGSLKAVNCVWCLF